MTKEELRKREADAFKYIRNTIVHDGISPSIRNVMESLDYKSPRSAMLVVGSLIEKGWLKRNKDGDLQVRREMRESDDHARTVDLPLVGSVSCGLPVLSEENVEAYIPVSQSILFGGGKHFLLRADGESMNQAGIQNGDILLIHQQSHAESGDRVVALIDDEVMVKEFKKENDFAVLIPRSSDSQYRPTVVSGNFSIQGVVQGVLPSLI